MLRQLLACYPSGNLAVLGILACWLTFQHLLCLFLFVLSRLVPFLLIFFLDTFEPRYSVIG